MMRSLFAGVSGLQNHQIKMDVIGSNIANVNTVGYKSSRTTFSEALSQSISTASGPTAERGGRNAQQIGLGSTVASIDIIHSQGGKQTTTSSTDLLIDGTGYFVLADGDKNYYTRAGMMDFDGEGNLHSKANGLKVLGYKTDSTGNIVETGGKLEPLSITANMRSISPVSTNRVTLGGNISAFNDIGDEPVIRIATVYDSLGASQRITISFDKTDQNQWEWSAELEDYPGVQIGPSDASERVITFNGDGTVATGGTGKVNIDTPALQPGQADPLEFEINFASIRQFAEPTSLVVTDQNGYPSGDLDEISVDQSGYINGSYTNGLLRRLGQVALVRFENPSGLLRAGDSMYAESVNSGNPIVGQAAAGGFGTIASNSLEMSNVDLSQEFTDMIITQRGFQANSRIITTADELLQELVNLKR